MMSSSRYVAVAESVVASFDQTHVHHSFTAIMEACCDTLIDADANLLHLTKLSHVYHSSTIIIESCCDTLIYAN
jgi:hypothetical protein